MTNGTRTVHLKNKKDWADKMNKGGFSWKRATGITRAKSKISRATGIPITKSGRQRKIGKIVTGGGCLIFILMGGAIPVVIFIAIKLIA